MVISLQTALGSHATVEAEDARQPVALNSTYPNWLAGRSLLRRVRHLQSLRRRVGGSLLKNQRTVQRVEKLPLLQLQKPLNQKRAESGAGLVDPLNRQLQKLF